MGNRIFFEKNTMNQVNSSQGVPVSSFSWFFSSPFPPSFVEKNNIGQDDHIAPTVRTTQDGVNLFPQFETFLKS